MVQAPMQVRDWKRALLAATLVACGNPVPSSPSPSAGGARTAEQTQSPGEVVKPPFDVRGDLEGLLLVWLDEEGLHTAQRRSEIPEEHRAMVRVDSLRLPPDKRLDPEFVYIADLRAPADDGRYTVRKHSRAYFEAQVDEATPEPAAAEDVVLYMASWCGACKAAAKYMRGRGVDFVEKDIEKDAAANAEMQQKARAKGLSPRGVPVIEFDGEILLGYDQARLAQLIDRRDQGKAL